MPEVSQPADRPSQAKVRTVVGVVVGLTAVLGAVVGGWLADAQPTRADVRAAAHSLVPPGYAVTSEKLNAWEDPGAGFSAGSYAVAVDVEGGGTLENRLTDFRRQASNEGWQVTEHQSDDRSHVSFERSMLNGAVTVGGDGGLSTIEVFHLKELPLAPFYAFAGALVGMAIGLVGGLLFLRSRRPSPPRRPEGT